MIHEENPNEKTDSEIETLFNDHFEAMNIFGRLRFLVGLSILGFAYTIGGPMVRSFDWGCGYLILSEELRRRKLARIMGRQVD